MWCLDSGNKELGSVGIGACAKFTKIEKTRRKKKSKDWKLR